MFELTLASKIVRNPDLITTTMDGEVVMLSIQRGEYFSIVGVGNRVWELIERPTTVGAICATICDEYDVDEAKCQEEILAFVSSMLDSRVVALRD